MLSLLQVLLVTTLGEFDIELWSKEAPLACRNFVQLCMEKYYNGTIFHRVVRSACFHFSFACLHLSFVISLINVSSSAYLQSTLFLIVQ